MRWDDPNAYDGDEIHEVEMALVKSLSEIDLALKRTTPNNMGHDECCSVGQRRAAAMQMEHDVWQKRHDIVASALKKTRVLAKERKERPKAS